MFSVKTDDPFIIFQKLQDIARKERGDADTIDLSRGDPGFGFVPSIPGREFGSYILWLDKLLNASPRDRFLERTEKELSTIEKYIEEETKKTYAPHVSQKVLQYLQTFIDFALSAAKEESLSWTKFTILQELFNYSSMSGGSYLKPSGQDLTRVIVAAWHRREYGVPVKSTDLILVAGASHAIGTVFKAFGTEGCKYLKEGDSVCIASPVYAPYNRIIEERGLQTIALSVDPLTGKIKDKDFELLRTSTTKPKILLLIDPNNPTGFSLPESELTHLAAIAKERDLLIISDEVYYSFFPRKKTMLALCPERTICINARSKIERSTGLRFGEIITLPEGRAHIAKMLGLTDAKAFTQLLLFAKAPGRVGGQFQHVTFVPGPSQLLGMAHIVLGGEEREAYFESLRENCEIFAQELSLPHKGNLYYIIFNLNDLPGCTTENLPMEERLLRLAKVGIVYIPAHRFFAEKDQNERTLTSVRASVVNTTPERLKEGARRTKEVLCT